MINQAQNAPPPYAYDAQAQYQYAPPPQPVGYAQPYQQYPQYVPPEANVVQPNPPAKDEVSSSSSDVRKAVAKAASVREANFLRKVYIIITVQLLVTVIITAVACLVEVDGENVGMLMFEAIWPMVVSIVVAVVCLIVLLFIYDKVPFNFILLGLYTLCWSVFVGCVAGPVAGDGCVEAAFIVTFIIFIGLTALTFIKKLQKKILYFCLFACLFCAIGGIITYYVWFFAIIGWDQETANVAYIAYCCIFAAVCSCYIVIDSLLARVDAKFNNYIYAAVRIYTDVVYMIIMLLALFGGKK